MNHRTSVAAAVTGGVAVAAAVLVAAPSMAADQTRVVRTGPGTVQSLRDAQQPGVCDGTAAGRGQGRGMDGQGVGRQSRGAGMGRGLGAGMGSGMGSDMTSVASGTLTATQKAQLASLAEEEKLAHDLYVAFAAKYGTTAFSRITNAETRHLEQVRLMLTRYTIADPTAGQALGAFQTPSTQQLYNKLVTQSTASVDSAYAAARTVETTDIADLKKATAGLTAPDVLQVYTNLLAASQRHLVAFGG